MTQQLKFGEIWLADLRLKGDMMRGSGICPVLIMQNQALLDDRHPSTLVIPLSTDLIKNAEPLRIRLRIQGKHQKDYDLLIDQICAVDNQNIIEGPLQQCDENFIKKVQNAILEVMNF
jgi:mRNA interferase MazF